MDFPIRKPNRLRNYDYSQNGAYFLTLCVENRENLLCEIVGDGVLDVPHSIPDSPPKVMLSEYGKAVEKHLNGISETYDFLYIDSYVIMPNHIHIVVIIENYEGDGLPYIQRGNTKAANVIHGTSRTPSPTNMIIPSFVSALKRFVNKEIGFQIWQRSYHDHIIRNEHDYLEIQKYINENPWKWEEDCFYIK